MNTTPTRPALASLDTEDKARTRHPSRGGGGGGARRPETGDRPGPRWSPLAWSIVLGCMAASALLWIIVIASVFGILGEYLDLQARIVERLADPGGAGCGYPAAGA